MTGRKMPQGTIGNAILATVLALGSVGCAAGASLEASSVLSYDQCRGIDVGLTRVDFADVAGIRGGTLLNLTRPDPEPEAPDEDLVLVAISRGQQSTPGYAMTLDSALRRDATALITVNWTTPESGAVLAQVVTHPCLVVALPGRGLSRVEAVDQSGSLLGSLDL